MDAQPEIGRRERKKAQTRQAISEAALALFLERGYDQVSVKEIADAADVAVTTLFKHFPGKEAMVFDEDSAHEAALVAAVRDRPAGQPVLEALREFMHGGRLLTARKGKGIRAFLELISSTPVLREYAHRMWMRHEAALADAIAEAVGKPSGDIAATSLAHFALESSRFAGEQKDPKRALDETFDLLARGWGAEFG
ncbi:TetR/AcrR family transcriptional regulator [Amycolatopsis minnesotensis]|uniref:TetR/AcrR family transcriptional regulator n=1 Tax=Amycolatopsis minnesotensis TaxID=337894 RepID=A0ABN2RYQ0_9PSEU